MITPCAPTANTPIDWPSGNVALSRPTKVGFNAAMPRPKLWANPSPEPRTRVGKFSVRKGPIPEWMPEAKKPREAKYKHHSVIDR